MESNVQTFHIQGNAKNYITWRWTTWNDVICSCASNEIMKIDYERLETLSNLLQSFEIYCCQKQIGLTCFRFKVPHKDLQKELVKIGF